MFCITRVSKGLETFYRLNLSGKKNKSSRKQDTIFPLECCCLPGKLQKQRKFVAYFVYKINEIPATFSNLGDWLAPKTRACLLRFSALNFTPLAKWFHLPPFPRRQLTTVAMQHVICYKRKFMSARYAIRTFKIEKFTEMC